MINYNIKKQDTLFWGYTILAAITILNDKISFLNIPFSVLYVFVCFKYAIKTYRLSKPALYIFAFSLFYLVRVVLSPDYATDMNSKWGMLNWALKVMLSFFPAYYIGRIGIIQKDSLRKAGIVFFIVGVISYYLNIDIVLTNLDVDGVTNNVGYLFVGILPLLFLNFKKNILWIILAYIFILLSLKRGAIVCEVATLPFFIVMLKKTYKLSVLKIILMAVVTSNIAFYYIGKAAKENAYVEKRIESTLEGNSSGREDYAISVINSVAQFDVVELLIGRGINYSGIIMGNFAHNDWLELLTSSGLIGCFFYLLSIFAIYIYAKKECFGFYRKIAIMILIIIMLKTVLSMNYFSLDSIPLYYTLGMICYRKEQTNEKNSRLYRHI